MKNHEALKVRFEHESEQEKLIARQSQQQRLNGNEFMADLFEMERQYRHDNAVILATTLDMIEKHVDMICRFENETGLQFDALGPLVSECSSCRKLYQHVRDHECLTDIITKKLLSAFGPGRLVGIHGRRFLMTDDLGSVDYQGQIIVEKHYQDEAVLEMSDKGLVN